LFDQVAQNRAGQLIAEGHAAKLLNLRSTLLTLAGADAMPSAAIFKLLSMRTGQGLRAIRRVHLRQRRRGDPGRMPASEWDSEVRAARWCHNKQIHADLMSPDRRGFAFQGGRRA
jgi:3-oxochol-4-en-24-oyl-CoA dehydrogenase